MRNRRTLTFLSLCLLLGFVLTACGDDGGGRDGGSRDGSGGTECFCCTGTFVTRDMDECVMLCAPMCPDSGSVDGGAAADSGG